MGDTAIVSAFFLLLTPAHLIALVCGTFMGLIIGFVPGLGGLVGLSLLLPFLFGLDPTLALPLMIGLMAPTTTSDTFPAVLMGIPGTAASQATVVDGFPMAQQGDGARALGAAFMASMLGGVLGAVILTGAIFIAKPLVLAVGFAEQMLLLILALSLIGTLTGTNATKGLAAACLGLLLGAVGAAPANGLPRLTFDSIYLLDGIAITILGLGLFALPEIFDLWRGKGSVAKGTELKGSVREGMRDALKHWWLILRCGGIGAAVGALPGLGGSVIDWIAYGYTVQSSKDKSRFGKGDIRGVIGPESANNAKEGGALIPTLLFGIPGSGTTAILMGGLVMIGLQPGVALYSTDLDLAYVIIWSLVLANILGALICMGAATQIAKLTTLRFELIAPTLLIIIIFAATQTTRGWEDVVFLTAIALVGTLLKIGDWSRSAFLIGFVLSDGLEASIYQTVQIYGFSFFHRPQALLLFGLILLSVYGAWRGARSLKKQRAEEGGNLVRQRENTISIAIAIGGLLVGIAAISATASMPRSGFLYPWIISILLIIFSSIYLIQEMRQPRSDTTEDITKLASWSRPASAFIGAVVFIALFGMPLGGLLYSFACLKFWAKAGWKAALIGAATAFALPALFSELLSMQMPPNLLQMLLPLPTILGG